MAGAFVCRRRRGGVMGFGYEPSSAPARQSWRHVIDDVTARWGP